MSANTYDVIVLGVGGMGSAACWHLARRGVRVLGLERFDIPHAMGSSHGFNRIIRLAYFEDPSYVPLLRRAYENWRKLEGRFGEQLLFITGSIDAGPEGSAMVEGSVAACGCTTSRNRLLDGAELRRVAPATTCPTRIGPSFSRMAASSRPSARSSRTSCRRRRPAPRSGRGSRR